MFFVKKFVLYLYRHRNALVCALSFLYFLILPTPTPTHLYRTPYTGPVQGPLIFFVVVKIVRALLLKY